MNLVKAFRSQKQFNLWLKIDILEFSQKQTSFEHSPFSIGIASKFGYWIRMLSSKYKRCECDTRTARVRNHKKKLRIYSLLCYCYFPFRSSFARSLCIRLICPPHTSAHRCQSSNTSVRSFDSVVSISLISRPYVRI